MEKRSEVRVTKTPGKKPATIEQFQQEKITRREALRRIGITTGAGLFMMFGMDDLARLAARKLERYKELGEVGETVAREFNSAGIALAAGPYGPSGPSGPSNPSDPCADPNGDGGRRCKCTQPGGNPYYQWYEDCIVCCDSRYGYGGQYYDPNDPQGSAAKLQTCFDSCESQAPKPSLPSACLNGTDCEDCMSYYSNKCLAEHHWWEYSVCHTAEDTCDLMCAGTSFDPLIMAGCWYALAEVS